MGNGADTQKAQMGTNLRDFIPSVTLLISVDGGKKTQIHCAFCQLSWRCFNMGLGHIYIHAEKSGTDHLRMWSEGSNVGCILACSQRCLVIGALQMGSNGRSERGAIVSLLYLLSLSDWKSVGSCC